MRFNPTALAVDLKFIRRSIEQTATAYICLSWLLRKSVFVMRWIGYLKATAKSCGLLISDEILL